MLVVPSESLGAAASRDHHDREQREAAKYILGAEKEMSSFRRVKAFLSAWGAVLHGDLGRGAVRLPWSQLLAKPTNKNVYAV